MTKPASTTAHGADREPEKDEVKKIMEWWRALYPVDGGRSGDAKGRARLRRAETAVDVVMEPAFHDLLPHLREAGTVIRPGHDRFLNLGVIAAVLCESRSAAAGGKDSFAGVLGKTAEDGGTRRMSELRFNALIKTLTHGGPDERLRALRRAMALAGDVPFNQPGFVRDLLHRFDDQIRIRWVYDYFQTFRDVPPGDGADTVTDKETIS